MGRGRRSDAKDGARARDGWVKIGLRWQWQSTGRGISGMGRGRLFSDAKDGARARDGWVKIGLRWQWQSTGRGSSGMGRGRRTNTNTKDRARL